MLDEPATALKHRDAQGQTGHSPAFARHPDLILVPRAGDRKVGDYSLTCSSASSASAALRASVSARWGDLLHDAAATIPDPPFMADLLP